MSLQSQIDILALGLCNVHKSIKAINPKITIKNSPNTTVQTFTGDTIVSINDADNNCCTTYNPDTGECIGFIDQNGLITNYFSSLKSITSIKFTDDGDNKFIPDMNDYVKSIKAPSTIGSANVEINGTSSTPTANDTYLFSNDCTIGSRSNTEGDIVYIVNIPINGWYKIGTDDSIRVNSSGFIIKFTDDGDNKFEPDTNYYVKSIKAPSIIGSASVEINGTSSTPTANDTYLFSNDCVVVMTVNDNSDRIYTVTCDYYGEQKEDLIGLDPKNKNYFVRKVFNSNYSIIPKTVCILMDSSA